MANLHAGVQRDGKVGKVGKFQCDVAIEPSVDESSGGVNDKAEAAKRALAFHASHQVVRNANALQGGTQDKLARMQEEGFAVGDFHQFGEASEILLHIEDCCGVVAKDPKEIRDLHVDAARLNAGLVEGLNDDATCCQVCAKVTVGKNHRGNPTQRCRVPLGRFLALYGSRTTQPRFCSSAANTSVGTFFRDFSAAVTFGFTGVGVAGSGTASAASAISAHS